MPNLLKLKKINGIHFVKRGAAVNPIVAVIKSKGKKMLDIELVLKAVKEALEKAQAEKADEPVSSDPQKLLDAALAGLSDETKAAVLAAFAMATASVPPAPKAAPEPPKEEPKPEEKPEPKEEDEKEKPVVMSKSAKEIAIEKKLADTEAELAKAKAKEALASEVEVAKRFALVPGDIQKRAAILSSIKSLGNDTYQEIVKTLDAAQTLIAKGLNAPGTGAIPKTEDNAALELDRLAKEIVEKSSGKLNYLKAYAKACKENPEVYMKLHNHKA